MYYDVIVTQANGQWRVFAVGFPEDVARALLWEAVKLNTRDADTFREKWNVQAEVRESNL